MRNVYIVAGEHDGIIGVYTNIRKARGWAISYARGIDTSKWENPMSGEDILEYRSEWSESFRERNHAWIDKEMVS